MNIVLVEFNAHHDECIFSQVAFLKTLPNVKLYLISNYRLKNRMSYLDVFEDTLFLGSNQWGIGYLRVLTFLNKNAINKVVFNSVPNKCVNKLLKICSSKKRDYYGVLHNIKDLNNVKHAYTYKRINSFFLLNDYLLNNVRECSSLHKKYESFYPIFFKKPKEIEVIKGEDEIWITIPGKMELKRRNYIQLFESFKAGKLNKNIKLIFLGKSDLNLSQEFKNYDVNNNCVFWDDFIDNDVFHSYLLKSDYILPIIHNKHISKKIYRYKISGSFNLAFSYHIPMILDSFFSEFEDFKTTSLFYNLKEDLIEVLNKLENPTYKFTSHKWNFDFQRDKYVRLLDI